MSLESSDVSASSSPPYAGEDVNALLTFADMVLKIDQNYQVDDDNTQMVLDDECIVQKEKDHTYAVSKRNLRNKMPIPLSTTAQTTSHFKRPDPLAARRSSSEENITKLHGLTVSPRNVFMSNYVSIKSQSFERMGPCPRVNKEEPPNFHYGSQSTVSFVGSDAKIHNNRGLPLWPPKDHTYAKADGDKLHSSVIMVKQEKNNESAVLSSDQRRDASMLFSQDHTYDKHLKGRLPPTPPPGPPEPDFLEADRQTMQKDHSYYLVEGRRQSAPATGHRVKSFSVSEGSLGVGTVLADRVPSSIDHTYSTFS